MDTVHVRRLVLSIAGLLIVLSGWPRAQQPQKVTINYPTRSGASWPLYIAKEGGYFQKYGLDVNLVFGVHPAGVAMLMSGEGQMVNHSLEQGMQASVKESGFTIAGSPGNKGFFALIARKDI